MSKAEKTRQYIIESTATLFNKNGFAGTSLTDMTSATGLTKGSIYGNFKNKEEVALEAFKYNTKQLSLKMDQGINPLDNAYQKLEAILNFYRSNWESLLEKGGCPLLNAATEVDDALPFMKATVLQSFKNLKGKFTGIIDQGKLQGEFKENINSAEFAALFVMLVEGGLLLSKTFEDKNYLSQALVRIEKIIKTEIVI